jgi:hypothetical protein
VTAIEARGLLGQAAFKLWPDLPREIQELLFEAAAPTEGPERTMLATTLHDHHPRTAHPPKPTHLT